MLELTPRLPVLSRSVRNLRLPDLDGTARFARRVTFTDLVRTPRAGSSADGAAAAHWAVDPERHSARLRDLSL